ncbi:AAA ATPase family protein [Seiridium cupressi]
MSYTLKRITAKALGKRPPRPGAEESNGTSRSSTKNPIDTSNAIRFSDILSPSRSSLDSSSGSHSGTSTEPEQGLQCEIKTLYEGPSKCQCCINWVETFPDDLRSSVERQAETKTKAVVARMRKNHSEGKPLVLDSIVVQSPRLKQLLSQVFHGYEGITTSLKRLVFKSPFHPFYYRWNLLTQLVEDQADDDSIGAHHARLFYRLIYDEMKEMVVEVNDLVKNRVITFEYLWAIFEPGVRIFSSSYIDEVDKGCFYIVDTCNYIQDSRGTKYLELNVKFVDYNGNKYGFRAAKLTIEECVGTRSITELEAYPSEYCPELEHLEAMALDRGHRFQELEGIHYMAYTGLAFRMERKGDLQVRNIDGRIVVDAASHKHFNFEQAFLLTDLDSNSVAPVIDVKDREHVSRSDQLILCTAHVRGYSLKIKKWLQFSIDSIKPISWNENAFPSLVLQDGRKDLILSFVESHIENKSAFDDVIEGKGQGVIMLLVGSPGVGKTLTAEAIADLIQKPLYVLSAGELGSDPHDVENKLQAILEITERWDAVLLFDECDVFLQKRSLNDMEHNEIVSVFLRILEYYKGILFMTSNRADAIDTAFQSRIHLTLRYPDLDSAAKKQIWTQFVKNSTLEHGLIDADFEELSHLDLNGRQIKNMVKISMLLGKREKGVLNRRIINTVLHCTEADATLIQAQTN